jgi:excisionase family DNA binding protein
MILSVLIVKRLLLPMAILEENIVVMRVISQIDLEVSRMEKNVHEITEKSESRKIEIRVCEKYTLTVKEAAFYFNIGIKKMRRLAEENTGRFSVFSGNKYLIIRPKFEKFIDESSEI